MHSLLAQGMASAFYNCRSTLIDSLTLNVVTGYMGHTDFTVQAWSGAAHLISHGGGNPGTLLFNVLDVFGDVIAAQGIVARCWPDTRTITPGAWTFRK